MASLDIVSLYTNIPVDKAIRNLEDVLSKITTPLKLSKKKIIKLVQLCTASCHFTFKDTAYTQIRGLPMGSPLSGVLACLFLEKLESGPFKSIIPRNSTYLRYIDDILLIHPRRTKIPELVSKLNSIEKSIQFTHELEKDSTLPFLDVLIHREDTSLLFSVYRKPTYKNDNIHFFSHHSQRIKSGIIIGAFLRAYRICSARFIENEMENIRANFKELKYPEHFIQNCQRKARKTFFKSKPQGQMAPPSSRVSLPTNRLTTSLSMSLNSASHQIVTTTSKTIREILRPKMPQPTEAGLYRIPCKRCPAVYLGETARSLKVRLSEHKRALRKDDPLSTLAQHRTQFDHPPDFEKAELIKPERNKKRRRCIEAAAIQSCKNTMDQRPGFIQISPHLGDLILKQNRIKL